jgi:hypothetical protein
MLHKNRRDFRRRGSGHDEIEVTNNLLLPSITPGNANMEHVRMSAQILLQRLSFGGNAPKLKRAGVLCPLSDRPAKFFLRRFSEAGQLRDPTRFAGCLKLGNRAHRQLFIECFDLFRAQAGKGEKLKDFSRKFRPQLLEVTEGPGFHQFLYFRCDCLADARTGTRNEGDPRGGHDPLRLDHLLGRFARVIVSWNVEDDDGQPVPPTVQTLLDQDFAFLMAIMNSWVTAMSQAPPPLPGTSGSGGTSPEASIPGLAESSSALPSSPAPG